MHDKEKKEIISTEEYLEKRENIRKSDLKLEEKKATIVKVALEFAYLYM